MGRIARAGANYNPRAALVAILIGTFAGSWFMAAQANYPGQEDFNIVEWEVRHLAGKWLYLTEQLWSDDLSREEEDARIASMLALTQRINQARTEPSQTDRLEDLRRERDSIENDVEAVIEGRLTAVLEDLDLESAVPLLPGPRLLWPPVDFEFDRALPVLSVSPRDRIQRIEGRPLRLGLSREQADAIEQRIEAQGEHSAIVDAVAGVATYPSLVAHQSEYRELVETVAHEWMHHYLFFKPLGRNYRDNPETRTMNETIANMAAAEIASIVADRYPLEAESPPERGSLFRQTLAGIVLRQLRTDVEVLLQAGRIDEAEELMERRRLELAEAGIFYRRLNQAFFAARSFYADTSASIDPLGPKLQRFRLQSGTLTEFIKSASQLESEEDLDRALEVAPRVPNDRER